jgi:serine protease Do
MDQEKKKPETVDEADLYEEFDPEELYEIIQEEKRKTRIKKDIEKPKRPFPRWAFWLIAIFMIVSMLSFLPKTFSIPILDFLKTSTKLSSIDVIDEYQESIVVVETGDSKGTGFSITADGYILTNHHVIEDGDHLWVSYKNEGMYEGEIVGSYPEIDLALLKVDGADLPHLTLASTTSFTENEHIYFIGNPLNFSGIANEGEVIGYTLSSDLNKEVLMLDAPVYHGNSGSPVINMDGEVIGVVYATSHRDPYGKVGLAIPISYFYEKEESKFIQ